MTIEMNPVSSSNVAAVGYEAETNTLRVEFNTGAVYDYHNVSPQTYEALLTSSSVGGYLNKVIKPQYAYDKVG